MSHSLIYILTLVAVVITLIMIVVPKLRPAIGTFSINATDGAAILVAIFAVSGFVDFMIQLLMTLRGAL